LMDMTIRCTGDLHIDDHHTVEDVGHRLGAGLEPGSRR
jgi:imidazoleglycerol-phosphate dehydratase